MRLGATAGVTEEGITFNTEVLVGAVIRAAGAIGRREGVELTVGAQHTVTEGKRDIVGRVTKVALAVGLVVAIRGTEDTSTGCDAVAMEEGCVDGVG